MSDTPLVFGASGQLATELARRGGLRCLSRAQADVSNPSAIAHAIAHNAPSCVINATAYTAVDKAESEEALALAINRDAPAIMARICAARGIPFLHVSTDYVFDGAKQGAWIETDPTGPLGAYGRSKLAGEQAVMAEGGQACILRTSWVYSPFGGNFVKTILRLAGEREHLRVVDDQIGCPTAAADLAQALLALAVKLPDSQSPADFGLFHFAGQGSTSWHGLTEAILAHLAAKGRKVPTLEAIPTSAYPLPAARPQNSVLDCAKIFKQHGLQARPWRDALTDCLDRLLNI